MPSKKKQVVSPESAPEKTSTKPGRKPGSMSLTLSPEQVAEFDSLAVNFQIKPRALRSKAESLIPELLRGLEELLAKERSVAAQMEIESLELELAEKRAALQANSGQAENLAP